MPTDLENKYDNGAGQAAHLLKYYLRMVARNAGVNWDSDNEAEVDAIVEVTTEADLYVVTDEVYEKLRFDGRPHYSLAAEPGMTERTLTTNGLSKSYAMTGWRVGFLAAPAPVIQNALKAGQNSITCVAPFIQKAAAFALTDSAMQDVTAEMRAGYARRRDLVIRLSHELECEKVKVIPPQGAFYFFLDLRALKMSSVEMCEKILDEVGVGLVPGSAFGEQGEGFIRIK